MLATREILRALASGASFFGSGGGGDCELGHAMAVHKTSSAVVPPEIVNVSALAASDLVVHVALFGSPEVVAEQIPSGDEFARAVREVSARHHQRVAAVGALEIGGINAMVPVIAAVDLGVPVVDSDLMGRAFPLLTQTTVAVSGAETGEIALVGTLGTTAVLDGLHWGNADAMVANIASSMGGSAAIALFAMTAQTLSCSAILGSVTRAIQVGEALAHLPSGLAPPMTAEALGASLLFDGRVRDVVLSSDGLRSVVVDIRDDAGIGRIDAVDEYLRVASDGLTIAEVPDVIAVLDRESLRPAQVDEVQSGQDVVVLKVDSSNRWSRALREPIDPDQAPRDDETNATEEAR